MAVQFHKSILAFAAIIFSSASLNANAPLDRSNLPIKAPKFDGKMEKSLDKSISKWPKLVKAPKGAPNIKTGQSAQRRAQYIARANR